MTGGKIEAGWFAVAGSGNYKTQNSIINITDGELISTADYASLIIRPNPAQRPSVAARFMVPQEVYASTSTLSENEGTALITSKGTGTPATGAAVPEDWTAPPSTRKGAYGIATVNIKGGTLIAEAKSHSSQKAPLIHRSSTLPAGTFSRPKRAEVHEGKMQM